MLAWIQTGVPHADVYIAVMSILAIIITNLSRRLHLFMHYFIAAAYTNAICVGGKNFGFVIFLQNTGLIVPLYQAVLL